MPARSQVSYSVDRVGRYLLHVRLRKQARPVVGSPFALVVMPGPPNASTTTLHFEKDLVGEVGLLPEDGCKLVLTTNDRVGNICDCGGGQVTTSTALGEKMVTSCTDLEDGRYEITWRSKITGTFDVKVLINNANVKGSPFKLQLRSSIPELPKTVLVGEGLEHAVAGKHTPVRIKLVDQFDNPCSPGPEWSVGIAITNSKKKVFDLSKHSDFAGQWTDTEGEFLVTYLAKQAGNTDMHVWCESASGDVHARESFPGSPFALHVTAGEPTPSASYVDGWTLAAVMHTKSKAPKGAAPTLKEMADAAAAEAASANSITAGDTVSVRAHGVDEFGNNAHIEAGCLSSIVISPDGKEDQKEVVDITRSRANAKELSKQGASSMYEIRHETNLAGEYELHVKLNGHPIMNSPVRFRVAPSVAVPQQSSLIAPPDTESLVADMDRPTVITLKSCDKFANACDSGGLRIQGRLQLVKQNTTDNTILMTNNHSVTVEDLHDGTYEVNVAIMISATVRLIVNMDKDLPGTTGELPPMQLTFTKPAVGAPAVEEPLADI
jgi:hypothetical protein